LVTRRTAREPSLKSLFDISMTPEASIYPQVVRKAIVDDC
jgi:hypothetical protein